MTESRRPVQPALLPLTPDETSEPFRLDGTLAVRSAVRELRAAGGMVALQSPGDPERFVVSRVLSLEADTIEFDWSGPKDMLQALRETSRLIVVGLTGAVKIQFELESFEQVRNLSGESILTAPLPATAWRVQRRNAFWVRFGDGDQAVVRVRVGPEREEGIALEDLSAGGLSMRWLADRNRPLPREGDVLRHCRIEALGIAPIPCDLNVIRVQPGEPDTEAHVSCEFHAMPQTVARHVQLYVMAIEKRSRAK